MKVFSLSPELPSAVLLPQRKETNGVAVYSGVQLILGVHDEATRAESKLELA